MWQRTPGLLGNSNDASQPGDGPFRRIWRGSLSFFVLNIDRKAFLRPMLYPTSSIHMHR